MKSHSVHRENSVDCDEPLRPQAKGQTQGGTNQMKNNNKSRQGKGSISKLVLAMIKTHKMDKMQGKDAAVILIPAVKKNFPGNKKFSLSHVYWYLGRYRRQLKANKPVDHIVELQPNGHKPAKVAKKALKKAKKVVKAKAKKSAVVVDETK